MYTNRTPRGLQNRRRASAPDLFLQPPLATLSQLVLSPLSRKVEGFCGWKRPHGFRAIQIWRIAFRRAMSESFMKICVNLSCVFKIRSSDWNVSRFPRGSGSVMSICMSWRRLSAAVLLRSRKLLLELEPRPLSGELIRRLAWLRMQLLKDEASRSNISSSLSDVLSSYR